MQNNQDAETSTDKVRDYLCVNKSQFVPVIFEPPCTKREQKNKKKILRGAWMFVLCVVEE
jgi:hypothetical protein